MVKKQSMIRKKITHTSHCDHSKARADQIENANKFRWLYCNINNCRDYSHNFKKVSYLLYTNCSYEGDKAKKEGRRYNPAILEQWLGQFGRLTTTSVKGSTSCDTLNDF